MSWWHLWNLIPSLASLSQLQTLYASHRKQSLEFLVCGLAFYVYKVYDMKWPVVEWVHQSVWYTWSCTHFYIHCSLLIMLRPFYLFAQVDSDFSPVFLQCYHEGCCLVAHVTCLAPQLCQDSEHLIPVSGECPLCGQEVMWGELVKRCKRSNEKRKELENVCAHNLSCLSSLVQWTGQIHYSKSTLVCCSSIILTVEFPTDSEAF